MAVRHAGGDAFLHGQLYPFMYWFIKKYQDVAKKLFIEVRWNFKEGKRSRYNL
jgi:hypothetical protein